MDHHEDAGSATDTRFSGTTAALSSIAFVLLATGCYHMVMPVSPPRLPDEVAPLRIDPRRTIRLINGYPESAIIWFRTEGIHHLGADLREWTDRLLSQLQIELEPRGVSALIDTGGAHERDAAALRVWITSIVPPDPPGSPDSSSAAPRDSGPTIHARLKSEAGDYEASFLSAATSHGFSDALYSLKESILVDGDLIQWLGSR